VQVKRKGIGTRWFRGMTVEVAALSLAILALTAITLIAGWATR
jgi:hypothetical protein